MAPGVRYKKKVPKTKGNRTTLAIICPHHGYFDASECPVCKKEREEEQEKHTLHINTSEWVKGWYEHIDTAPVYIDSKTQLAKECEKRGLYAKAILKRNSQGRGHKHKY